MKITKDMLIGDIIQIHPDAVEILFNFGLSCVGCPASQMESLEEATMVHGLNLDLLLEVLNEDLEEEKQ